MLFSPEIPMMKSSGFDMRSSKQIPKDKQCFKVFKNQNGSSYLIN